LGQTKGVASSLAADISCSISYKGKAQEGKKKYSRLVMVKWNISKAGNRGCDPRAREPE
jgi:RecB family endonuclease NucS